jgi:two-component system nitrogen regulation sensor histidine kinase NtrY
MQPLFKKEAIEIKNNIDFNRWILVDPNQMEQVFINLLTNSMFALQIKKIKKSQLVPNIKINDFIST